MELIKGKILKRYKRFLADIELENGEVIVAHTANTGSMKSCYEPGWPVLLSYHDNPKRKLKYSLEMTNNGKTWIGVNTSKPNHIVFEAIENNQIKEIQNYSFIKKEHKINDKSRIDIYLKNDNNEECFIEIKNVTLKTTEGVCEFPDAVTTRGQKHLKELITLKENNHRCIMFYLVQREDVQIFRPAKDIDPEYARLLKLAKQAGVEILVYQCKLNEKEIKINKAIPYELN